MDNIIEGMKRLESFLEYTNQLQERLKVDSVLDDLDNQVCYMLFDMMPSLLSMVAMASGISEFAKQQFVLGILWERFRNSENDEGLNDLLNGVKGL